MNWLSFTNTRIHRIPLQHTYTHTVFVRYVFSFCLLCPMLPMCLDCPFLIALSVFSNVYGFNENNFLNLIDLIATCTLSLIIWSIQNIIICTFLLATPTSFTSGILWVFASCKNSTKSLTYCFLAFFLDLFFICRRIMITFPCIWK